MNTATLLTFPAKVDGPVQQRPRRGPLPKSVRSLPKVRRERAVAEFQRQAKQEEALHLFHQAEKYLYALYKLKGMIEDDAG